MKSGRLLRLYCQKMSVVHAGRMIAGFSTGYSIFCGPVRLGGICRSAMGLERRSTIAMSGGAHGVSGKAYLMPWPKRSRIVSSSLMRPSLKPIALRQAQKGRTGRRYWTLTRRCTSKVHVAIDAKGRPHRLEITGGHVYDS